MADARAGILNRIRTQLGRAANTSPDVRTRDYEAIPRLYTQAATRTKRAQIELLLERLADYDAVVVTIREFEIAATVAEILDLHHESTLLVPAALPTSWLPPGIEILRDDSQPHTALTSAQAVLTPCACAIAETGTILLEHGPQQGRRAITLLPDHHICILRRDQIVETVSEGFALLSAASQAPITTISGPSATADIEMTRIRGVHGPRRLTVLLVTEANP